LIVWQVWRTNGSNTTPDAVRCSSLFGRRKTALKILLFDGSGLCQFYQRIDRGTFRLPEATEAGAQRVEIDDATLEAILDAIEVEPASKRSVH
jgi:hypothetical protein